MRRHRPLLTRGPIFRFLRHVALYRITDAGRTVFWITIFAMGAGQATLAMQIYLIFCVSFGLVLTSLLGARWARCPLKIEAPLPARTMAGSRLTLPVVVTNQGKRTALDLILREASLPRSITCEPAQGVSLARLEPEQTWQTFRQLEFHQRGIYVLPGILQQTVFPWGMWADLVWHEQARTVRVYPAFVPLQQVHLLKGQHNASGDAFPINLRGESLEFMGVREYRPTDDVKTIHPRTWARLGRPAVREFLRECSTQACLLLDLAVSHKDSASEQTVFEAMLSLAAAAADCLLRQGFVLQIGLLGGHAEEVSFLDAVTELEEVLDLLAAAEATRRSPETTLVPSLEPYAPSLGSTLLMMPAWGAEQGRWLEVLSLQGVGVRGLLIVGDAQGAGAAAAQDGPLPESVTRLEAAQIRKGVVAL